MFLLNILFVDRGRGEFESAFVCDSRQCSRTLITRVSLSFLCPTFAHPASHFGSARHRVSKGIKYLSTSSVLNSGVGLVTIVVDKMFYQCLTLCPSVPRFEVISTRVVECGCGGRKVKRRDRIGPAAAAVPPENRQIIVWRRRRSVGDRPQSLGRKPHDKLRNAIHSGLSCHHSKSPSLFCLCHPFAIMYRFQFSFCIGDKGQGYKALSHILGFLSGLRLPRGTCTCIHASVSYPIDHEFPER